MNAISEAIGQRNATPPPGPKALNAAPARHGSSFSDTLNARSEKTADEPEPPVAVEPSPRAPDTPIDTSAKDEADLPLTDLLSPTATPAAVDVAGQAGLAPAIAETTRPASAKTLSQAGAKNAKADQLIAQTEAGAEVLSKSASTTHDLTTASSHSGDNTTTNLPDREFSDAQTPNQHADEPSTSRLDEIRPSATAVADKPAPAPTTSGMLQASALAEGFQSVAAQSGQVPSAGAPMAGTGTSAAAPGLPATPTALVVAVPERIGKIIVERASAERKDDNRILVQLDPPELGRVGIDFRYDTQGVPQITVTAETPEALRQLRQMHADLLAALDRNGISGGDVQYQENPTRQGYASHQHAAQSDASEIPATTVSLADTQGPAGAARARTELLSETRLDIRL